MQINLSSNNSDKTNIFYISNLPSVNLPNTTTCNGFMALVDNDIYLYTSAYGFISVGYITIEYDIPITYSNFNFNKNSGEKCKSVTRLNGEYFQQ